MNVYRCDGCFITVRQATLQLARVDGICSDEGISGLFSNGEELHLCGNCGTCVAVVIDQLRRKATHSD